MSAFVISGWTAARALGVRLEQQRKLKQVILLLVTPSSETELSPKFLESVKSVESRHHSGGTDLELQARLPHGRAHPQTSELLHWIRWSWMP